MSGASFFIFWCKGIAIKGSHAFSLTDDVEYGFYIFLLRNICSDDFDTMATRADFQSVCKADGVYEYEYDISIDL